MEADFSLTAAQDFQDYGAEKGLFKSNTSSSRKGAMSAVLGWLSEEERADLRKLDLDDVFNRWVNRNQTKYPPATMQVYFSRVKAGVNEFLKFRENPAAYRPLAVARKAATPGSRKKDVSTVTGNVAVTDDPDTVQITGSVTSIGNSGMVFSLPVRPGVTATLRITGLPQDLTAHEATDTANLISALVQPLLRASATKPPVSPGVS